MVKTVYKLGFWAVVFALTYACGKRGKSRPTDTATSGEISVTVDDSYEFIMGEEKYVFENTYPDALVHVRYKSEYDAFDDLLKDSVRFIVVNRNLNSDEEAYFKGINLTPKVITIAYDAVAFIIHKDHPLNALPYSILKKIFAGEIKTWNQVSSQMKADSIVIVFDHPRSGNPRYLVEQFKPPGDTLPSNCFAVNSNPAVIDYVEKNPHAIGVMSVNWVSDHEDSLAISFLNRVKVAETSNPLADSTFYGPYQAYIANGSYPFKRNVYLISREARSGLGTGFASFIAGDIGQRIILKAGIVPAKAPVRIMNINIEN